MSDLTDEFGFPLTPADRAVPMLNAVKASLEKRFGEVLAATSVGLMSV